MSGHPVYLHVGLPKTGTTHLQDRMWVNRDSALAAGLFYPGDLISSHFHAAVLLQPERYLDWVDPVHSGVWDAMVTQMRAWDGPSLISHELYASATHEQAARVRRDLAFAELHIVVTARDLGRQIPSTWQENVKNQHTTSFDEFLAAVDVPRPDFRDPFWEFQDLPRILDTWADGVPAEQVHVVTVPGPDGPRGELWARYLSVFGLAPADLPAEIPSTNAGLSMGQVELLRRLNIRLQPDDVQWSRYERAVKEFLVGRVLFAGDPRGGPVLPKTALPWATACAEKHIQFIAERGFDVVGDLDDLLPREPRTPSPVPDDAALLEITLDALAGVMLSMPLPEPPRTAFDRAKPALRAVYRRSGPLRRLIDRFR
ncbi:sulfotransferase family protein [Tsukamurella sp. 8F]|uniref:sulfotransferase family protein n=1 Tax=unclassified Tsukamurella TaxID=2633480 RepID=UPI0023B98499|nr:MULTISPECIES: sulfotransferase family protein [unclassified Tsukamurella]MDF0528427.1 sulfotransferase family protein [Tsukamurella sp. 8J]MDF0586252.1 sulfotransferase family protein [Tsukamurella sp. 8F]